MEPSGKITVMPTKLRYKLLVSFCLMSLLPILAGVYLVSVFVKFPFEMSAQNLWTVTMTLLFSMSLSFMGYMTTKQLFGPISDIASAAKNIAQGKPEEAAQLDAKGSDELEDL